MMILRVATRSRVRGVSHHHRYRQRDLFRRQGLPHRRQLHTKSGRSSGHISLPNVMVLGSVAFTPVDLPELEEFSRVSTKLRSRRTTNLEGTDLIGEKISLHDLNERYTLLNVADGSSSPKVKFSLEDTPENVMVGYGAYGQVYRAKDQTGKEVAIKVVSRNSMSWENLKEEVEALMQSRKHRHVMQLLEVLFCPETGKYYLITEFLGGELFDRLIDQGPYPERRAKILVQRVSSALNHIHRSGFAHFDLKPENLLFAKNDDDLDIRLVDFGMAKSLESFKRNGYTYIQTSLGTTPYLAPEVLKYVQDEKNYLDSEKPELKLRTDPRACDMWSLGVIIYIILLGCHPFDREGNANDLTIARRALAGSTVTPEDEDNSSGPPRFTFDVHKRLRLSDEVKDLISKLLDPNPETRLTSEEVLNHPWLSNTTKDKCDTKYHTSVRARSACLASLVIACISRKIREKTDETLLETAYRFLRKKKLEPLLLGKDAPEGLKDEIRGLELDEFKSVLEGCYKKSFPPGGCVFKQGDEVDGLYVITKGSAQLEYTNQVVAASLSEGDVFGETAILDGRDYRNATVKCITPVEVVFWSREGLISHLGEGALLNAGLEEHIRRRQNARAKFVLKHLRDTENLFHEKILEPGQALYYQGENSDMLYFIENGVVNTSTVRSNSLIIRSTFDHVKILLSRAFSNREDLKSGGGSTMLRTYRNGEILGTESVIGTPRIATARCVTRTKVQCLCRGDLERVIPTQLSLHNNLLRLYRRDAEEKGAKLRSVESITSPNDDILSRMFSSLDDPAEG